MSIPPGILYADGSPYTPQACAREFGRSSHLGEDSIPGSTELMALLNVRPNCWNQVLAAGLPTGVTKAVIRDWLTSNGWLE